MDIEHDASNPDEFQFSVTITNPHSFKDMVRGFSHLLISAPFQFVYGNDLDFTGMKVCCIDRTNTCFIDAQYKAHIRGRFDSKGVDTLNLNVKILLSIMKKVSSNCVCYLKKKHEDDKLHITYEDATGYHTFFIKSDTNIHPSLEFTKPSIDYSMDFKVNLLKNFVRTSKTLGSDAITIQILSSKKDQDNIFIKFFFASMNSECGGSRVFLTNSDFSTLTMHREVDRESVNILYSSSFRNSFLDMILKSVDKDATITVGLKRDSPLMLQHDQGIDDTFTRFILASVGE